MKDMAAAVKRVKEAVNNNEKILVYGDYDVDGVTSTALLTDVLRTMGADCEAFIPNRLEDGYGLNTKAVTLARDRHISLIITVDCGINSFDEVKCADSYGIDVIITDHHVPQEEKRPPAVAIVDPHQQDCEYPFKFLAGVGIAFKFAKAVLGKDGHIADKHLDLVALGTIADVVPVYDENRILVKEGLKKLRFTDKAGLRALVDIACLSQEDISCRDIAFGLGPRINAMGRIGSAEVALDLLLSKDSSEAIKLAKAMDEGNRNRQGVERDILKKAVTRVKEEIDLINDKIIVLADEGWHPGVIGIVASRLTEQFSKSAVLISLEGNSGKGSGRALDGFNLFGAIDASREFLTDFGGHEAACGLKIEKNNIDFFRERINAVAPDYFIDEKEAFPELKIDMRIPFAHIGTKLVKELKLMVPYGVGNPEPVFSTNGMKVKNVPRNIGRNGFKFLVTCGNITYEAITFNSRKVDKPRQGDIINLAYYPTINNWRGISSIQLNIQDLHIVS
jgi:single-stranded-DNA-specific exonuclease